MVAPDTQVQFVSFLDKYDIKHELIIENVERYRIEHLHKVSVKKVSKKI